MMVRIGIKVVLNNTVECWQIPCIVILMFAMITLVYRMMVNIGIEMVLKVETVTLVFAMHNDHLPLPRTLSSKTHKLIIHPLLIENVVNSVREGTQK